MSNQSQASTYRAVGAHRSSLILLGIIAAGLFAPSLLGYLLGPDQGRLVGKVIAAVIFTALGIQMILLPQRYHGDAPAASALQSIRIVGIAVLTLSTIRATLEFASE